MGRVLQKEGGCGRREDGVGEGGRDRGTEGVWRVIRRQGVGEGYKGREGGMGYEGGRE